MITLQMMPPMMFGGLVNSMGLVSLQTLGFSEIPKPLMSHATALSTMAQQVSISFGVVIAASLVSAVAWLHGSNGAHLAASDFSPVFVAIGLTTLTSLFYFRRLSADEGAEMRYGPARSDPRPTSVARPLPPSRPA